MDAHFCCYAIIISMYDFWLFLSVCLCILDLVFIHTLYMNMHVFLTLGAHAQEGYCTCPVCLCICVCYDFFQLHRSFLRWNPDTHEYIIIGFSWFLTRGFSINPSVQKLWREKANMQMSIYRSRPVSARFKYRAYINRYLQAAHWVSDRFLARFVHLDAVMASITSIHLPRSRSAVLQRTSARFSVDGCFQSCSKC